MQLQQLGLSGYGYSPSSSGAGSAATGGTSTASGGATTSSANGVNVPALGPMSSVTALANVRESESLNFKLADGTQVTIRMRAHATAMGAAQTLADGTTSSAAALIASGQMQIEVKGNLSSDDLKAINDVVSQVDSLATQFFSGDAQGAFAAAASLNIDPTEIASFSLKLSYSSEVYQQATANAAAAAASSTTPASGNVTNPATSIAPGSTSAASPTSDASSGASSNASSGAASDASSATPSASPQQIIINFVQQAMTKLRMSSGGSHDSVSSRWKVKLLAQALPVYAQAQTAGASAPAGTTSSPTASQTTTAAAQTAAAPQAAKGVTALQSARLAADTLNRLAEQ